MVKLSRGCPPGLILLRFTLNYGRVAQPTSFFTVKPTDTDTKGNLPRGGYESKFTELPAGADSEDSNSIIRFVSSNYPDREDNQRRNLIKR